ncbi:MAG: biosynthetic-type acetolactate synthase large subunit [Candidatus Kryptonium sp.]|nr:biosynthetic-type acetolactate synthase large subunit [Candidatus Kryptonium sp.]MCX7761916.1 biosynthetic-type acetolactate synthase large subunit [Candidatus Kryptonium sp.]MDW8108752.1 biosynthetic-type acetolactate synthase large subunit [Candidatus Kryptonium sp.]
MEKAKHNLNKDFYGKNLSGIEIFVRSLIEENVEVVFGCPGNAVLGIFDALMEIAGNSIKIIFSRHEAGAVLSASGYARATGKPGVLIVSSGPGASNVVTGIADANMDSIPLVVFTAQVPTKLIGNETFQEVDIVGITRPITKHNFLVTKISELMETIKSAFYIATTGRPGPVLVDLPRDVMSEKFIFNYPDSVNLRGYNPVYSAHAGQIKRAAEIINNSSRPVIIAGGGVIASNASGELRELVRKINAPITTTLMGQGTYPEDDPLSLGMLGMHGTWYANMAVNESDCIIAIGSRFDERITGDTTKFAPNAKKIHIDIDPASISKNVKVDVPIVGDVKDALKKLIPLVKTLNTEEWLQKIKKWKIEHPIKYQQSKEIKVQYVIEKLRELTGGNAILVTDVGQFQMWTAQFFKFLYPRTHITSGGLGTMGFSLPASIGVATAVKDRPVISLNGNRGVQMNIQEIATISAYNLPIKILIFNDGHIDITRQWQELHWKRTFDEILIDKACPDFMKIAEAYGIQSFRVETTYDVEPILKKALALRDKPVIIEFKTAYEENVYPYIPPGGSVKDIIEH